MQYLAPVIALIVGFLVGLLIKGRKPDTGNAPISVTDLLRLYEQVKQDVLDDIARDATIEKLRKRLGL